MPFNDSNGFVPVLALTVLDRSTLDHETIVDQTRMLVVVRDPETNSTHPDVVSVPTQRIPIDLWADFRSLPVEYEDDSSATTIFAENWFDNTDSNGHNPLIFAVESLLSRKLGLAESLETDRLQFAASISGIVSGRVQHVDHSERTLMINAKVVISKGAELIPGSTASYSHMIWTRVDAFKEAAAKKAPMIIDARLDWVDYCIHGLCIMSSYNIIAHALNEEFYPYNIYNYERSGLNLEGGF